MLPDYMSLWLATIAFFTMSSSRSVECLVRLEALSEIAKIPALTPSLFFGLYQKLVKYCNLQRHHIGIGISRSSTRPWSNQSSCSNIFASSLGTELVYSDWWWIVLITAWSDKCFRNHWSICVCSMIWQNMKRYSSCAHFIDFIFT